MHNLKGPLRGGGRNSVAGIPGKGVSEDMRDMINVSHSQEMLNFGKLGKDKTKLTLNSQS